MAAHGPNITPENPSSQEDTLEKLVAPQASPRVHQVVWRNVIIFTYHHLAAVYGLWLLVTEASWSTIYFNCLTYYLSGLGVMAGVHRLWSHRSFKARKPLQIFLIVCHSMANQDTIYQWVRDHRLHHKYSDTDADPYNASRGLFFSHIGWVMVKKHPEIKRRGKLIDYSDIYANPVVMFQKRHKAWLIPILAHVVPVIIPICLWNETVNVSCHLNMLRYVLGLNAIFMVNSLAHKFGSKPYDKGIFPTQNLATTLATLGEGFHNYHHTFPQDYKAGELGNFLNFTTRFIDFCSWIGLAYDLKSVSDDVVKRRMMRTGDGDERDSLEE